MKVLLEEYYGADKEGYVLVKETDNTKVQRYFRKSSSRKSNFLQNIRQFLQSAFLPRGYPSSVSEDYLTYQIWDTIQGFCSSITNTLATEAVLKGFGVGSETATPLAATLSWLLKDGFGMIGRIIFAWWKSSGLDSNCKQWRLFADILNDAAICIDLIAPNFPHYFTVIICVSNVAKSLVGVAGGATRAALTQHQARNNNMADVSAKDGSQETLVNLLALITGLLILPLVSGNTSVIWTLFTIFTFLHIYANYRAVSCVQMETLNTKRLLITLHEYFIHDYIVGIKEVNKRESVFLGGGLRDVDVCGHIINFGSSLKDVIKRDAVSVSDLEIILDQFSDKNYLIWRSTKKNELYVVLNPRVNATEKILAFFHAVVMGITFAPAHTKTKASHSVVGKLLNKLKSSEHVKPIPLIVEEVVNATFPAFLLELRNGGWTTSYLLLQQDEWKSNWNQRDMNQGDKLTKVKSI